MKNLLVTLCALVSLVGCASMQTPPAPTIEASKALGQKFTEAFSSGNVDAVMDLYWHSPEVVLYPPDEQEVRGWENIKHTFTAMFSHMKGSKLELINPQYQSAGDAIAVWGTWKITPPACHCKMKMPEMVGRFSEVQAVRDGKLVLIVDHASIAMPPATGGCPMKKENKSKKGCCHHK